MIENAETFLKRYSTDDTLRDRVARAMEVYPGSLEIREALVENVLIPIALEMSLPFTVAELRAYETRVKMRRLTETEEEYQARVENEESFWLLDNGWEYDDAVFMSAEGQNV